MILGKVIFLLLQHCCLFIDSLASTLPLSFFLPLSFPLPPSLPPSPPPPPLSLSLSLSPLLRERLLDSWQEAHNAAAPPPTSPTTSSHPLVPVTLLPFGATDLRIAELPTTLK